MHQGEQHEMFLAKIHPSGVEEWFCTTCGRSLLVIWKPRFMIITREAGDQYVTHKVSKDGLHVESAPISFSDIARQLSPEEADDPRLAPWIAWMEKVRFENLWGDEDQ